MTGSQRSLFAAPGCLEPRRQVDFPQGQTIPQGQVILVQEWTEGSIEWKVLQLSQGSAPQARLVPQEVCQELRLVCQELRLVLQEGSLVSQEAVCGDL